MRVKNLAIFFVTWKTKTSLKRPLKGTTEEWIYSNQSKRGVTAHQGLTTKLLQNKDDQLSDKNLEDLGLEARKQDKNDNLGSPLTINELGSALKQMKLNKMPGINGITFERKCCSYGRSS